MSAAIDVLFTQGEALTQATGHGRTFLILSGPLAGTSFAGTLHTEAMIDPDMGLGSDPREGWMLDVILPGPALGLNDRIQEGSDTWKIVRLPNPSYITASYEVIKVEPQDH